MLRTSSVERDRTYRQDSVPHVKEHDTILAASRLEIAFSRQKFKKGPKF